MLFDEFYQSFQGTTGYYLVSNGSSTGIQVHRLSFWAFAFWVLAHNLWICFQSRILLLKKMNNTLIIFRLELMEIFCHGKSLPLKLDVLSHYSFLEHLLVKPTFRLSLLLFPSLWLCQLLRQDYLHFVTAKIMMHVLTHL